MKINSIAFVGYPVTDLTRSRAFYEQLLGLKPGDVWEHEGKAWIEYDLGTATFAISNMSAEMWKPSSDGPAVAFEMDDLDAAISELRAAGVKFYLEPMGSPVCRMAVIADPDGNSIVIHRKNAA